MSMNVVVSHDGQLNPVRPNTILENGQNHPQALPGGEYRSRTDDLLRARQAL